MTDPNPPVQPLEDDQSDTGAFAAYNTTLERFVGPVARGKGAKRAAGASPQAKAAKDAGHDVEVRAV